MFGDENQIGGVPQSRILIDGVISVFTINIPPRYLTVPQLINYSWSQLTDIIRNHPQHRIQIMVKTSIRLKSSSDYIRDVITSLDTPLLFPNEFSKVNVTNILDCQLEALISCDSNFVVTGFPNVEVLVCRYRPPAAASQKITGK